MLRSTGGRIMLSMTNRNRSLNITKTSLNNSRSRRAMGSNNSNNSTSLKPWSTAVVESTGDYRDEAWLEDHIADDALYRHQRQLPKLPVPTIPESLERLMNTIVYEKADNTTKDSSNPQDYNNDSSSKERESLAAAVAEFPQQAAVLQERLLQRADSMNATNSSWLSSWWNRLGYLQVRDRVVINVSYFLQFSDDGTILCGGGGNNSNTAMCRRGATLLHNVATYRNQLFGGALTNESVGRGDRQKHLCSVAYKYMLHACRIPKLEQDSYKIYDPSVYRHAVVQCRGHFFTLDIVSTTDNDSGSQVPISVHALERGLHEIVQQAQSMPVLEWGYLSSMNRDDCAEARNALMETMNSDNKRAMELLESGAVLLCLDDDQAPVSRAAMGQLLLHGGGADDYGTSAPTPNRWYDKSVQLIVSQNGKAGLLGEHSMMDGMPVVRLADHVTKTSYGQLVEQEQQNGNNDDIQVQAIFTPDVIQKVNGNPKVQGMVQKAKSELTDFVGQYSMHNATFHGYGSTFMKQAGFSPDAYCQMVMQIATYRLWQGQQGGTYEATQVRPFLHGRTETTRSVSSESTEMVEAFGLQPQTQDEDKAQVRAEKIALFRNAVQAHVKYLGLAAQGQGVDRHFLGLALCLEENEPTPDLLNHPAFVRSKRWRVSTSNLTHPKFDNWGYGPVVEDGVGLAYSVHPRHAVFNITALKHTGWSDALAWRLEEAMLEVQRMVELEVAAQGTTTRSKL